MLEFATCSQNHRSAYSSMYNALIVVAADHRLLCTKTKALGKLGGPLCTAGFESFQMPPCGSIPAAPRMYHNVHPVISMPCREEGGKTQSFFIGEASCLNLSSNILLEPGGSPVQARSTNAVQRGFQRPLKRRRLYSDARASARRVLGRLISARRRLTTRLHRLNPP